MNLENKSPTEPILTLASHDRLLFHTGRCWENQSQCLIGILSPGLVLVTFNLVGDLKEVRVREFSQMATLELSEQLALWIKEFGFRDELIHIKPFDLHPDHPICLDIVSGWTRDILANPQDYEPEDVQWAKDDLANWTPEHHHAFTWNTEHSFNANGQAVTT